MMLRGIASMAAAVGCFAAMDLTARFVSAAVPAWARCAGSAWPAAS
jgi:hypothetical protein